MKLVSSLVLLGVSGIVAAPLPEPSRPSFLDGKILPNGKLDPILISMALAGMVAIPVTTQSIWDYKVRIELQPGMALGTSLEDHRYSLRFLTARF